jgi:hypothetical protein
MPIFEKGRPKVIWDQHEADLSKASISKNLSAVGYDNEEKYFYITIDRVLFSDPVSTIKTVLDAHGFVPNLENILSCLDSLVFSVHTTSTDKDNTGSAPLKVNEYLPCIRFELPQKNRVGDTLQSYYDEIAKYETKTSDNTAIPWSQNPEVKKNKGLIEEIKALKESNKELQDQVNALTYQLSKEQKSLSRASRALDSQRVLPDNTRIGRVEQVDLKRRMVKVKCQRKVIDIPTHMLDKVPDFQARCLVIMDEGEDIPVGIIFLNNEELGNLEKRTAKLLYIEGDTFKARDSMRNDFQIKAVNEMEAATIKSLSRGMKVIISIADGYIVRFSVLGSTNPGQFRDHVQEQYIVYGIARNQLVNVNAGDNLDQ